MDIFKELVKNIATVEDLSKVLNETSEAESISFSSEAKKFSHALKGKVSSDFEDVVTKAETAGEIPQDSKGRAEYFSSLKTKLQGLPKIEIELAFAPSEEFSKKISSLIRETAKADAVLDVKVKPAILAGATLGYNGQYKDYSFSSKLDEVLKQRYSKGPNEEL